MAGWLRRAGGALFDQPYLLLSLTALFWAGNIVSARYAAGQIPPVTLAFIRWSGAFALVLPFAWPHLRRDWPAIRSHFALMTVLSVTGISAYNTMAYWGLQYTEAINGLLLQSTNPLHIALWTFILFGERLTRTQTLGIFVSLAGVIVIICRGDPAVLATLAFNPGDLWIFAALITNGIYSALLRRRPAIHPVSFLAFTFGWGALFLVPLQVWEIASGHIMQVNATTVSVLTYIVIFPGLLAYHFFNRGIELIGPNRAAPFLHLIPVFGSILAIAFLGERLALFHVLGYALVLAGIVTATRLASR
jgi:drug/metabolite transporter (DMT)-like permease